MTTAGFAVPILAGNENLATKCSIGEIRRRMTEHEESRKRAGIIMERGTCSAIRMAVACLWSTSRRAAARRT